jgi:hypothetical protein
MVGAVSCANAGAAQTTPDDAMLANKAARIIAVLGDFIVHSPPILRVFTRLQIAL